jgi:hypothetical protein
MVAIAIVGIVIEVFPLRLATPNTRMIILHNH